MTNTELQATYRILDASANRAGEGLRTMEEFARFVRDDAEVSLEFKSLRHGLACALNKWSRQSLLTARDTAADVGTQISQPTEYQRSGLADVIAAAAVRTQQSLRVLEEYGKTIDPLIAAEIEQLRYRCYTVSAKLELQLGQRDRSSRLQKSLLYVLVEAGPSDLAFSESVQTILAAGADIIQLRDHSVDDRTLLSRARAGAIVARSLGKLFIMNDRPDLAVAADTDGVHVGQDEMPVAETRQLVGRQRVIGVSTHSIDQARRAVAEGADYIGCGPVFPGSTKTFDSYVGTRFLKEVVNEIALPAFAIGGIDAENLDRVIETGLNRIAVTGAIRDADNPAQAAQSLKTRLSAPNAEPFDNVNPA